MIRIILFLSPCSVSKLSQIHLKLPHLRIPNTLLGHSATENNATIVTQGFRWRYLSSVKQSGGMLRDRANYDKLYSGPKPLVRQMTAAVKMDIILHKCSNPAFPHSEPLRVYNFCTLIRTTTILPGPENVFRTLHFPNRLMTR